MTWIILYLVVTFGISWWNAYVAGSAWLETKITGGFIRLVVWCAAIQSAIGFTIVYGLGLGAIAYALGYIPARTLKYEQEIIYLAIIIPALGTGWIITIHSWIQLYRERSLLDLGVTAWNTYASIHNTVQAVDGIGSAIGDLFSGLGSSEDDDDGKAQAILIALIIAALALAAGCFTTYALVKKYEGRLAKPVRMGDERLAARGYR